MSKSLMNCKMQGTGQLTSTGLCPWLIEVTAPLSTQGWLGVLREGGRTWLCWTHCQDMSAPGSHLVPHSPGLRMCLLFKLSSPGVCHSFGLQGLWRKQQGA